jgi:hypothetical protein
MESNAVQPSTYQQGEAQTLRGVIGEFEQAGYTGHFGARERGVIRCFACQHEFSPKDASIETVRRLEGASDPDDMLAVVPVTCSECGTRGTLVLSYGPEASLEDSEVLAALPDADHPPTPDPADGI